MQFTRCIKLTKIGDAGIAFDFGGGGVEPVLIGHRHGGRAPRGAIAPFHLWGRDRHDPLGGMLQRQSHLNRVSEYRSLLEALFCRDRRRLWNMFQISLAENLNYIPGCQANAPDRVANVPIVHEYRNSYRSYRNNPAPRSTDDGVNPLLRRQNGLLGRASRDGSIRPPPGTLSYGPTSLDLMDLARGPFGASPATSALFDMLRSQLPDMPGNAPVQFRITAGPGHEFPREFQAMFGRPSGARESGRRESQEPLSVTFFTPQPTNLRWTEECKLLFGSNTEAEVKKVKPAVEAALAPAAIEADKAEKAEKAAAEERARKLEEEAKKRQEEERLAKEAKEAEEKLEREKKEAEELEAREAAERAAAQELGEGPEAGEEAIANSRDGPDAMEGVETEAQSSTGAEQSGEAPAADRPRITTQIRGQPYDITDLGIDADFLAELPDDIREEVIMATVAERRSQAAATGAHPSESDHEFLDALPEDIRAEIIQQERQERRRRDREEQRRQQGAAVGGGPAAAPDMDIASLLATLTPALRQQILLEQDEETLANFPQEIADQARAAQREHPHPGHQVRIPGTLARTRHPFASGNVAVVPTATQRAPRRAIVQMLDRQGVATLLRLMFTSLNHPPHLRTTLWGVLEFISHNRQNRNEVISTILHVLQDGSVDMSAVERSFANLSLRAKQPKEKDPKTPQPLKRTYTGMSGSISLSQASPETSPRMVVNQCLSTLLHLTKGNPHVPAFFLTEQETVGGLKRNLSRKGKGKENKASKYAINSLLSLLDRDLIMESSSIMDSLATLLSLITLPLQNFQRKKKEAEEAEETKKKDAAEAAAAAATSTTTVEPASENLPSVDDHTESVPVGVEIVPTESSNNEATLPDATVEGEASTSDTPRPDTAPKEPEKKPRSFVPPVIPEQNLKLIINIFVARECSSKTFRDTLSTTKNLSAIPGAKAIFGRELIAQAQKLGAVILDDLEDLLPQIQKAATGTEIQGVALAKFSPGGSDQNKLLRVLTALDHLFDPKREKKDDQAGDGDAQGESSQTVDKQDLLSSLYENSTFGPMWEKLSACLSAIRQREHMLSVATILLPLIESLMVVCKNTTSKEVPVARSQQAKEMMLGSPPPESRMENLFFTFTEEHRKILNDLVRHTPKLMSGTFSLLVKNPKVLEFDNKRNYFSRSIHNKSPSTRQAFPALQLAVRRDLVFHDSYKHLYFKTGDEMKYGKLSIRFHGEEGVDAGGVTREWFQVLSRQMFDPGYALFVPVSSDRTTFHPNQLSSINEEHLLFFKFIGRIIGKALYENRVLDCHFSRAVYKRILGKSVSVKDMESLDPDYYKSLIWMLENDITDIITETFSVDNDKFGVVETIDFIPNGRNIQVTEQNKHEYVRLMVEWRLTGSVKEQLDEFLRGMLFFFSLSAMPREWVIRLCFKLPRYHAEFLWLLLPLWSLIGVAVVN
jgi:E3 ubiquitin-protein ligase HUWE1